MMLDALMLPLQLDFMQYALAIAVLVAIPASLLSCFLVLKGWALIGDAIAHGVFPGVVLAYMLGLPYAVGAFSAGMVCALATGYIADNSRIKKDTVMGVVFSGMFAIGLLLYTSIRSDVHLDHILFGDILGVDGADLRGSGLIALVIGGWVLIKWRELLLHAFDPIQARTIGLRVGVLHYGLLAAVSLAVVGALHAVGIILAISLLIAPGAIAYLLTRTFGFMLLASVLIGVCCAVGGVYLSFFLDSAPAPTIVLLLTVLFVVVLLWSMARQRRIEAGTAAPREA
ncbi:metal ABC transporter permease [Kerstersia gyiorum]|uniref:Membrane protein n=2 Tax=Kerstersia gyiorum TaxID=206506 RepID=A0A171KR04_9BURK|nr:metal ABC transporter permease [Kerstersia gyiorum]MCO7640159.1 metal ABC transporter permease [Pseudomonas sp. S 311-6]KAB0543245.1 metal ABC transporter permease [Kerstersia gyiorum]KKO71321.1 membrane protein [Kerstersia gyiorum]MCP1632696.1 manganese/iron transport system permease protein [Kerstersia gyiorum]MCP1635773.1 manganese/iron transport system permease protein [Kerstersia gyiorum]